MKVYNAIFLICSLFIIGCGPRGAIETKKGTVDSLMASFEMSNYLKLDRIYSGPVFIDRSDKEAFYRVVEIPVEERLLFFVEKVSIGEEGGNFQLMKRYRVDLGPSVGDDIIEVDSLVYMDSVLVSAYFNKSKYKLDLERETIVKY